jgi:UrcA family protein
MRTLSAAVAACLLTTFAAGAAGAATNVASEVSTEALSVGNVNFRDAAEVRAFHKRLQQSAMFVCNVTLEARKSERLAAQACAEKAVAEAVNSLNRPLLTATYQQAGAPMVARGY